MSLIDRYHAPTPVFWRKMGDAILSLGTLLTGSQILMDNHNMALVSLGLTWLGKTITNFATPENGSGQ